MKLVNELPEVLPAQNAKPALAPVSLETVEAFADAHINGHLGSHGAGITGSYLQDNRHTKVSERFQVIQAASVGAALADNGLKLVSLITGRGRHADKKDFQRTVSRYRSNDAFEIDGLSLDIIYVSKHMGRGQDELRLGLYRGVCANAWTTGSLFDVSYFRHSGNPLDAIKEGIANVLAQRSKLVDTIRLMQGVTLNAEQIDALAKEYAMIRLANVENPVNVQYRSLANVRRQDDAKLDLFTVANVLQENVIHEPIAYGVNSTDNKGQPYVRSMHTRRLRESSTQLVDLNAQLFDAALKFAA